MRIAKECEQSFFQITIKRRWLWTHVEQSCGSEEENLFFISVLWFYHLLIENKKFEAKNKHK